MEELNEIPANVLAIIKQKEISLQEEREREEKEKLSKEMELIEKGKQIYGMWVAKSLQSIPVWLESYLSMTEDREPNFERLGKGWDHVESNYLFFIIPGLSEIQFDPKKEQWRAAVAYEGVFFEDEFRDPYYSFRDVYWKDNLESTLMHAKHQFSDYQKFLVETNQKKTEYEALCAERAARARNELDERDQLTSERESEAQRESTEEQVLFDAIKNDPVMVHILKALVLIHEERGSFVQRIEYAEESAFWAEEHQARIANQMQRQIDAVKRQAEDEKSRLQNDLDDTEEKLKKAERAQRGW